MVPRLSKASTADLEAPEPSGLGFPSAQSEGAQAVVQTVATEVSQARQVALQRDAEGAVNILRLLDTPAMREYRALRVALHDAKGVAFLTQQCTGLGLGYLSGTGFVLQRLGDNCRGVPSWSAPAYVRTHAGCLGVIAGYEYVRTLLVFSSDNALQRFVGGELHLGANVSLMAGSHLLRHMAARPRRLASVHREALSFSVAAGAMLNCSVQVGWTSSLHTMNNNLFSQFSLFGASEVTPQQLLSGQVEPPAEFKPLYSLLARYAFQPPWS